MELAENARRNDAHEQEAGPEAANVIRRAKVELADAQNETICDHEVFRTPTVRSPWMTTGPYRAALQTGFEMIGP